MKTNKKFLAIISASLALMVATGIMVNPNEGVKEVTASGESEYNYPAKDTFRVFIDRGTHYIDGYFYEIVYAPTADDLTNK